MSTTAALKKAGRNDLKPSSARLDKTRKVEPTWKNEREPDYR